MNQHHMVLQILDQHGPLRSSEIANHIGMTVKDVSCLLLRLKKKRCVEISSRTESNRAVYSITEQGIVEKTPVKQIGQKILEFLETRKSATTYRIAQAIGETSKAVTTRCSALYRQGVLTRGTAKAGGRYDWAINREFVREVPTATRKADPVKRKPELSREPMRRAMQANPALAEHYRAGMQNMTRAELNREMWAIIRGLERVA